MLIAPNLESGAILLRTLTGAFGALAAGVALGAKVPVVLPARGESMEVRMASCMLASVFAHAPREGAGESKPVPAATATTDLSAVA